MDFNALLKQAQKMQEEAQKKENEIKQKEYVARVGTQVLHLTMNGQYQIVNLTLDNEFVKYFTIEDKEILEDTLVLAFNDCTAQIEADNNELVNDLTGGLNIPGLF